jgi:hypothetical protein
MSMAPFRADCAEFTYLMGIFPCLAGRAAEEFFCGKIDDASDRTDIAMAKDYLARAGYDLLEIGFQLNRFRDAAERLVRSEWAQQRIRLIADALLQKGTLSGEEISIYAKQSDPGADR